MISSPRFYRAIVPFTDDERNQNPKEFLGPWDELWFAICYAHETLTFADLILTLTPEIEQEKLRNTANEAVAVRLEAVDLIEKAKADTEKNHHKIRSIINRTRNILVGAAWARCRLPPSDSAHLKKRETEWRWRDYTGGHTVPSSKTFDAFSAILSTGNYDFARNFALDHTPHADAELAALRRLAQTIQDGSEWKCLRCVANPGRAGQACNDADQTSWCHTCRIRAGLERVRQTRVADSKSA